MWPVLPSRGTPTDWRAAALHAVRQFCGWHIAPVIEEDLTLDGSGQAALLLPSNRVEKIISLQEDGKDIDVTTLSVSEDGIVEKAGRKPWTRNYGGVSLTLRHGYEQFDDLEGLVSTLAARAAVTGSGALSETAGPFNVRRGTTRMGEVTGLPLLESEKDLLLPYRLNWGV